MGTVGVRELKEQTSQILRRVREGRETVEVTYRGKVVARLVPVEEPCQTSDPEFAAIWASLDEVAAELGARCPAGVSAVDAVRDVRREL